MDYVEINQDSPFFGGVDILDIWILFGFMYFMVELMDYPNELTKVSILFIRILMCHFICVRRFNVQESVINGSN